MAEENLNTETTTVSTTQEKTESKKVDFSAILTKVTSFLKMINEKLPFGRLAEKAGEKVAFLKKVAPFANLAVVVLAVFLVAGVVKTTTKGGSSSNGMVGNTYKSDLGGTITFKKDGTYTSTLMYLESKEGTFMVQNGEKGVQAIATRGKPNLDNNGFKTEDNGKTAIFYAGGMLPIDTLKKY